MANNNITETRTRNIDLIDNLTVKTAQLSAMLGMIYGGGYESFNQLPDYIKENYLWACVDHIEQIHEMAVKL